MAQVNLTNRCDGCKYFYSWDEICDHPASEIARPQQSTKTYGIMPEWCPVAFGWYQK